VFRYAECHYTKCHYAECHYAECQYAVCHYAECPCASESILSNWFVLCKEFGTFKILDFNQISENKLFVIKFGKG
jgi:hypothetical protein